MYASPTDIKPRSWMLALCVVAMADGIALMFVLPNPLVGLGPCQRPVTGLWQKTTRCFMRLEPGILNRPQSLMARGPDGQARIGPRRPGLAGWP